MKVTVDLSGADLRDDLDTVNACLGAVSDLVCPGADLCDTGRDRLATLLMVLHQLATACTQALAKPPRG